MRPLSNAFEMVRTMASWPIKSAKLAGRYLRAKTRYSLSSAEAAKSDLATLSVFDCAAIVLPLSAPARTLSRFVSGNRWEADERPDPCSLGLLPSGPDPVGEWLVHRQPPGDLYRANNGGKQGRRA